MSIAFNSFVRRQTADSPFSHWTLSDEALIDACEAGKWNPGYRDGVFCVAVDPEGFFSGTVQLQPGDKLVGEFTARREGEDARKHVYAAEGSKLPAKAVEVVLYAHDVLAEDGDAETEADYEIVSVNARPTLGDEPIPPLTLLANHFGETGGTATNMSDEELVAALREGFHYWKDKANVAPQS